MPAEAILFDPQSGRWLHFRDPLEELEVHEHAGVLPALESLERRVEAEHIHAAGFVSYEAAAAFDDALTTHPKDAFPLLRFGVFATVETIDLTPPREPEHPGPWHVGIKAALFSHQVAAIRAAIARGETYQVNLTFQLTKQITTEPWALFRLLAAGQRVGGAGFLQSERWAICSLSPELFFHRDTDRLVMRPMKGTAPRGCTLDEDRRHASMLQQSAKNRAENIMILDMVRNDLGRLATPGTVRTEAICSLERYPTVWQLTSTISARSPASLAEIFRALFPCASITGAPKAKTMEIIAKLEATPRRIYTGTFGWLAPGRQARFNVAIRTLLIDRHTGSATYGVGAGITWDSVATEEYRECLDKATALQRPGTAFALIETLRWSPGKGYFLLPEHLARLESSAEYFDFPFRTEQIRAFLQLQAAQFSRRVQRVRLLLHADGRLEAESTPLAAAVNRPVRLALATTPVDVKNAFLYHKTTRRDHYTKHLAEAGDADEVVLWNERHELTECCTANLVVKINGRFLTPPLNSGLLPGTYRAFLLRHGVIEEAVIRLEDLLAADGLYLVNAVRKWRKAEMIEKALAVGQTKKNGPCT